MHSSLTALIRIYQDRRDPTEDFVLATIIDSQGSTYRKPGARMLISREGRFHGLLGGGCFEGDLIEHARGVFEYHSSRTIAYDMRGPEDLVWGLGLGCNGAVQIRLDYAGPANDYSPLALIAQALERGERCILASVINSDSAELPEGTQFLLPGEGDDLPGLSAAALSVLATNRSQTIDISIDDGEVEIFMGIITPPVRLLVIGGGPDAIPVAGLARQLGWQVRIVDYRDAWCVPEHFPEGAEVIKSLPEELPERLDLEQTDAVVLMTHRFDRDLDYLRQFADSPVPYIGLLGPAARKQELLKSLDEAHQTSLAWRCYGPVGLDTGGELPEEIALSLIAGIQAALNNRTGGPLDQPGSQSIPTATDMEFSVLVLAAGGSRRFGALKQLLELDGMSLLQRAVRTALDVDAGEVLVVHGPKALKCRRELDGYKVRHLDNENWESGMSSSIRMGIQNISTGSRGVLILLCDQPLLGSAQLTPLIDAWRASPEKIVASQYGDSLGVPAIFPRSRFEDLKRLYGDKGARELLADETVDVIAIPLPEAAIDIDTEADFTALLINRPASD